MSTPYSDYTPADPSCLIAVDMQRQFETKDTGHIFPGIQAIVSKFDYLIASRIKPVANGPIHRFKQWMPLPWDHPDSELAIDLSDRDPDKTLVLGKAFFSAFTAEAREWIKDTGVTEFHICGMDTDMCVMRTATDVMEHHYRPVLLRDLCASTGGEPCHSNALLQFKRIIGKDQILPASASS